MSSYQQIPALGEDDVEVNTVRQQRRPGRLNSVGVWRKTVEIVAIVLVLVAVSVILVVSNAKSSTPALVSNFAETRRLNGIWTIYKVTTSITVGTYAAVQEFATNYLCLAEYSNLGCNLTNKVACNLAGQAGIHWVDSSVFNDLSAPDRSISEWNKYIESLGTDSFNPFMHNKVQLFVSDLTAHYAKFTENSVPFMARLSMSSGSSTYDIAHVSVSLNNTGTVYEIVGPSGTLTSEALARFSAWEDISCPSSHSLPYSLDELLSSFEEESESQMNNWEISSGLQNPMLVQVQVPMSGLSNNRLQDTLDLVSSMSKNDFSVTTVTTGSDACTYATADIKGVTVRYVENDGDFSDVINYDLTVGDWEADVLSAAGNFVSTDKTQYSWNRYLDNHIGIYIPDAANECEGYYNYIEDTISDNGDFDYGLRVATTFGVGTHYYTATAGIRSWEFNADLCARSNETDICGCLADNSRIDYEDSHGTTECPK
jgi:hypothetical protein